jgi:prefoldin subunit 4
MSDFVYFDIHPSYKVGEAFLHLSPPRALKLLGSDRATIATQMALLTEDIEDLEKQMKELKIELYAKFGRAINLDD